MNFHLSKVISLSPAFSHIAVHQASLYIQPVVNSQSETAPLLPKCTFGRRLVGLSRKKMLL